MQPHHLLVPVLYRYQQNVFAKSGNPEMTDATKRLPKLLTDVFCRTVKPKIKDGVEKGAKYTDSGGLYLRVTPGGAKLWQMAYRFHGRQKTYSIGRYGKGDDGSFSLAQARRKRDEAKDLLKSGSDPGLEKQLAKHREAATRPFGEWIDEWLAVKKTEKIKRGKLVTVRSPMTITLHELWAGYLKKRFGKFDRKDIKRPDVVAYLRSMTTLETRDRIRSIGEAICTYADLEGDSYNPFRDCRKQLTVNVSTPRPGVTEAEDVVRLFRLINQPYDKAKFRDVVGDALRLDALTIPRPGMIHSMEWQEVDWDAARWTIPAVKMKSGWDHVVPLSRQATAVLERVQKITGNRRYVFSCADDEPLSNRTLNMRLRGLGIDTKTEHCAHGFRTTFSTLCHHEEHKEVKAWDLESSTVKAIYKRHGPLALIGPRTKLMQHWADRVDSWLDPKKVVQMKPGLVASA
jgi:integrase